LPFLSACSPVSVLNALAPRGGIAERRDIAYGEQPRQALDLYIPAGATAAPVVVFFYGGRWSEGDRSQYRFVGAALADLGFLCVVPDYRVFPAARFPAFLQDGAAAIAWTRANIAEHGGDPERISLIGHSAGAHIATMLTLDKQWLAGHSLDSDHVLTSTTGLAGPYDFLPLEEPDLEAIFAPAGDLRLTQPITFSRGGAAPLFLAAGDDDTTVRPANTRNLAASVRAAGGTVETRFYRGVGHRLILGSFAGVLRWYAPVLRDVASFLGPPLSQAHWKAPA